MEEGGGGGEVKVALGEEDCARRGFVAVEVFEEERKG